MKTQLFYHTTISMILMGVFCEEVEDHITTHPNIPMTTKSLLLKLDSKASNIVRFDTFILKNIINFFTNLHIDHNIIT